MSKLPTKKTISPKGELSWVFISGEGRLQVDPNKPRKYEASVKFKDDDPKLLAYENEIKKFWKANKPAKKPMKSNGIFKEYTKDEEGEKVFTGYSFITFKTLVEFKDGKKKVVRVYNAAGKNVTSSMGERLIGNGSIGYISGDMGIYDRDTGAGVTLYLNGVQLTKFVEYDGAPMLAEAEEGWDGSDLNEDGFTPDSEPTKQPAKLDLGEDDVPF